MTDDSNKSDNASNSGKSSADEAKAELASCEKEIGTIKACLRSLTSITAGGEMISDSEVDEANRSGGGADMNALSVAWIQTDGLDPNLLPELKLELSSPVEEVILSKELDTDEVADNTLAVAVFRGVETGQATLTFSICNKSTHEVLGTSTSYDVAELTKFDVLANKKQYESEIKVEIKPRTDTKEAEKDESGDTAVNADSGLTKVANEVESKDSDVETTNNVEDVECADEAVVKSPEEPDESEVSKTVDSLISDINDTVLADINEAVSAATSDPITELSQMVCTITFKVSFYPSEKDRREELYDLLNKTMQRKSAAVDKLRKAALEASRMALSSKSSTGQDEASSETALSSKKSPAKIAKSSTSRSPAVKSGFLNKSKKEGPSRFRTVFNRTSATLLAVVPLVKNYIFFVSFVTFMHFKGQLLALPPPV